MVSRSKPAFTIVELLVVIVVIGILAAITVVSYTGISQKAIVSSLQTDLTNASKLLKMDQVINSAYPATLAAANGGKGIPSSSDTTYQYVFNNSITPPGFCITATKSFTTYKVTENTAPEIGDCTDYGLVLYLDAGNTASYPSPFTGTTWYDLSGMGNNASLVNGVTYSGINGGSLLFDGVDDYGYVSSNFFQKTQNEFTIEIVSNSLFQLVTRGGSGGWWTTTNQFTLGVIADYPLSYAFNSNTPYIINYCLLYTSPSPRD